MKQSRTVFAALLCMALLAGFFGCAAQQKPAESQSVAAPESTTEAPLPKTEDVTEEAAEAPETKETEAPETAPAETEASEREWLPFEMAHAGESFAREDGTVYYYYSCDYPVFSEDTEGLAVINQHFTDVVRSCAESEYVDGAFVDEFVESNNLPMEMMFLPYFEELTVEVKLADRGFVSTMELLTLFYGGTNPYYASHGMVYDVETGEQQELERFLQADDDQLSALIELYGGNSFSANSDNMDGFYLSEDGLVLLFWAGSSMPRYEVTVPYTDPETCFVDAAALLS